MIVKDLSWHNWTEEQLFDYIADHLLAQRKRSINIEKHDTFSNEFCAYRGNDGLSCAAGCLIPDDLYEEKMEHQNWDDITCDFPLLQPKNKKLDIIIKNMQHLHDTMPVEKWEEKIKEFKGSLIQN